MFGSAGDWADADAAAQAPHAAIQRRSEGIGCMGEFSEPGDSTYAATFAFLPLAVFSCVQPCTGMFIANFNAPTAPA